VKKLYLIPSFLFITAAVGNILLRLLGWNQFFPEMSLAAAAILLATGLGMIPILWFRHSSVLNISQAALIGTVLQMFAGFIIGAAIWYLGGAVNRTPFLYWLLAFYWVALTGLVAVIIDLVRHAAPRTEQAPPKQA
jgi:hypothetical protein